MRHHHEADSEGRLFCSTCGKQLHQEDADLYHSGEVDCVVECGPCANGDYPEHWGYPETDERGVRFDD